VTPADLGARARLEAAFARQERRGLMLAAGARSVGVLVIVLWVALSNPERGLVHAWVFGTALLFAVTGLVQFWLYARDLAPALAPYLFALVDSLVLAAVFVVPNPFAPAVLPVAIPLR
jgi:adenylate cyclase